MRAGRLVSYFLLGLVARHAVAQETGKHLSLSRACLEFNERITVQTENGRFKAAEAALSEVLAGKENGLGPSCDWMLLNNMAAVMSASGRIAEAENMAARSVAILEKICEPDDRAMLRPLQVLGTAQYELGKISKAREALRRMQLIRSDRPFDRAIVRGLAAALFETEGLFPEAEREYLLAVTAWKEAGMGQSANMVAALQMLGRLYLSTGRLEEAGRMLRRAGDVLDASRDAAPMDRINLLNQLSVLHVRQGDFQKAEGELRTALAMVDVDTQPDPVRMVALLTNYGYVLRKNHRSREARAAEASAAALASTGAAGRVIDASELFAESKKGRK